MSQVRFSGGQLLRGRLLDDIHCCTMEVRWV